MDLRLVRMLRHGGYEPVVERVETAAAMKAALDAQPWDVVLSDFSMPSFSAPEALAMLKATGEGITRSLSLVEVSFLPGEPARLLALCANRHWFTTSNRNRWPTWIGTGGRLPPESAANSGALSSKWRGFDAPARRQTATLVQLANAKLFMAYIECLDTSDAAAIGLSDQVFGSFAAQ